MLFTVRLRKESRHISAFQNYYLPLLSRAGGLNNVIKIFHVLVLIWGSKPVLSMHEPDG
jgi:hypothetical protein